MTDENEKAARDTVAASRLHRAVARFMAVPRFLVATLILLSIAINFANVIGRYVFLAPIIWAEEVMIFMMVWCVFIGAALVSWDDRHLRMDLLSLHLWSPWREAVNGVVAVTSLALFGFVIVQSFDATVLFARLGQKSNTAGVPMLIPHAALLIGFALMFIAVAVRFRAIVTGAPAGPATEIGQDYGSDGPPSSAA